MKILKYGMILVLLIVASGCGSIHSTDGGSGLTNQDSSHVVNEFDVSTETPDTVIQPPSNAKVQSSQVQATQPFVQPTIVPTETPKPPMSIVTLQQQLNQSTNPVGLDANNGLIGYCVSRYSIERGLPSIFLAGTKPRIGDLYFCNSSSVWTLVEGADLTGLIERQPTFPTQ